MSVPPSLPTADLVVRRIGRLYTLAGPVPRTGAGLRESHVHDVKMTREAPNYSLPTG